MLAMHLRVTALFLLASLCSAAEPAERVKQEAATGDVFFYFPTQDVPATPATWGFRFEEANFKSKDGTKLSGWLIANRGKQSKGTVVFSHGAAGSMGHHLGFVMWLAEAGYHVLIYDYRGYGKSQGKVSRRGSVDDAKAALEFVSNHSDLKNNPIISYGHSLGGAKSVAALAESKIQNLKAVIVDSSFSSYRNMAQRIAGKIGSSVVSDELSPIDAIAKISPTPLLVIHGAKDPLIPKAEADRLFKAAKKPKTLYLVENGSHGDALARDDGAYRKEMLKWLDEQLDK